MTADEKRLRAAGLRATRPRLAVLAALREMGGHRGADEILAHLPSPAPTRTSVYNILRDLTTARIVLTADAGPGTALYEIGDSFHHHFVCRVCGQISDVACAVGARPCLEAGAARESSPAIAEIDEAQVIFRGRCARCAAAGRTAM